MLKHFRFIRIHLAAAAVLMGGILVLSPMAAAEPSSSIYDASGRYLGRIDADPASRQKITQSPETK